MFRDEIYRITQDIDTLDIKKEVVQYQGYKYPLPTTGTKIDEIINGKTVEFTFVDVKRGREHDSFFADAVVSSRYKKYMKKKNLYYYEDSPSLLATALGIIAFVGFIVLIGLLGQ